MSIQQGCTSMLPKMLPNPGFAAAERMLQMSALAMSVLTASAQPHNLLRLAASTCPLGMIAELSHMRSFLW